MAEMTARSKGHGGGGGGAGLRGLGGEGGGDLIGTELTAVRRD